MKKMTKKKIRGINWPQPELPLGSRVTGRA
jgi:hypothetical protein